MDLGAVRAALALVIVLVRVLVVVVVRNVLAAVHGQVMLVLLDVVDAPLHVCEGGLERAQARADAPQLAMHDVHVHDDGADGRCGNQEADAHVVGSSGGSQEGTVL